MEKRKRFLTILDESKIKELKKAGIDLDLGANALIELLIDNYLPELIKKLSKK